MKVKILKENEREQVINFVSLIKKDIEGAEDLYIDAHNNTKFKTDKAEWYHDKENKILFRNKKKILDDVGYFRISYDYKGGEILFWEIKILGISYTHYNRLENINREVMEFMKI